MSTRWQIAAKLSDGRFGCIYVHCDGYPSYALATLAEHYTEQEKIDGLIALGDCLSIGDVLSDCNTFYGCDGEAWDDIKPTFGESLKACADAHHHSDEEYRYFWDGQSWAMADF